MTQEVMIPMRDGIRLQSFVFLPDGDGPFPSLMVRCMYGTDAVTDRCQAFVEEGYAVVAQNVRGRHKSEGGPTGRHDFPQDGYDTIEWIITQAWCNGRVGTFGGSALARVQAATAFLAHPAHRAMCPQVLPYGMMSRLGGSFFLHQIPMWYFYAQSGPELQPYDQIDWLPHLGRLPATSILDELGGPLELFHDVLTSPHENYFNLAEPEQFQKLNTPNLIVTGWYDHCGTGPIDFFTDTMEHGTDEQKRDTHLVIGPWDHSCDPDVIPDYDFGPAAKRDHHSPELAFFARHLKEDAAAEQPAPVRIFVMGKNEWRDEASWPLERAVDTKFYLHSGGDVHGGWVRGSLTSAEPDDESPDRFEYDPSNPVPTWGGANSGPARVLPGRRGPRDQQITLYRDDVLVYESETLDSPLEVTGPLKLVLFAASSAIDTDFTAKLMDVAPDGNARLLSDGVVRARYRNGMDNHQFLTPEGPVRFEIDLWSTSNEFQVEHRIALAISSSNFPRLSRNLNTGGDNERDADYVTAYQTVFHDRARPSHLVLPVVT
jgi:predicted acyl esterase